MTWAGLWASIPSPSSSAVEIGPLALRAYGVLIALGVLAAVWLSQRRWAARGGNPEDVSRIALWAVPAGLVGSRVYHVVTDWRFDEGLAEPFKIWEGGLGIPGGMAAGIVCGIWVIRRNGWDQRALLDCVVPALPLAQAIGRWGNWFNQELFGRPSDLPWALEIDADKAAAAGHPGVETFHPVFLYESLWNLALAGALIALDRSGRIRKGSLVAVYVLGYLTARLWLETVRIDPASEIAGLRVNIWMSIVGIAASVAWLAWRGLRPEPDPPGDPLAAESPRGDSSAETAGDPPAGQG